MALSILCFSMMLLVPLTQAGGPSEILTVWSDRPEYSPGETGKLYIAYNNIRDIPVTIKKITVVFTEWWAYDKTNNLWMGNLTYVPPENEKTISERTVRIFEIGFTVPSDGRARDTKVEIKVYTHLPVSDEPSKDPTISVAEPIFYMEQIVTLFTVQVVLIIVCSIIIAATIFLSARRPQVMWRKEEKAE